MKYSKVDSLGDLLKFANSQGKANKIIVLMTALLVSWREMEVEDVVKIVDDTRISCGFDLDIPDVIGEMN